MWDLHHMLGMNERQALAKARKLFGPSARVRAQVVDNGHPFAHRRGVGGVLYDVGYTGEMFPAFHIAGSGPTWEVALDGASRRKKCV